MLGTVVVRGWMFFFFKQKTAYEMRISDWSSDVCSSDLDVRSGGNNMASFICHVVGVAKRVRLERIVRPHLPPQRHRGGSPFNQQIATRTIERARTKRVNPLGSESGGI